MSVCQQGEKVEALTSLSRSQWLVRLNEAERYGNRRKGSRAFQGSVRKKSNALASGLVAQHFETPQRMATIVAPR